MAPFGQNKDKPFERVKHTALKRAGDSPYWSSCPYCTNGGLLMMQRAPLTFKLQRYDRCTFCLQGVIYEDTQVAGEALEALPANFEKRLLKPQ